MYFGISVYDDMAKHPDQGLVDDFLNRSQIYFATKNAVKLANYV